MGDFIPTLSGLFGGSHLNAMMYTLEVIQLVSYIKYFWKKDRLPIRILVILCFLIDTLCTIAIFSWVLMYSVVHWGDQAYLAMQYWQTPAYVFCTTAVGFLVQSFLISRYFILSSQRITTIILGVFTLAAFAGGISVAVILIFFATYEDRAKPIIACLVWLVSTSIADLLIMLSLVYTLSRAASGSTIRSTKALIRSLILVSIQSGTVTTVLALLVLAIYLAKPMTNDSAYFSFCLGRAYTLTMLFNLNLRKNLQNKCHGCGMNTLRGTVSTAARGQFNKSLQVGVGPVEHHRLGNIGQLKLDKGGLVSTEDSEGTDSKGTRVCEAPNASGTV